MISFRSKITQKVLGYFLLNTETEMYLNEMARKFTVDRGNLSRKLSEWERIGILKKKKLGNLSIYSINKKYSFLNEIKAIYLKSYGLEAEIKNDLTSIGGLNHAYIFGSYAQDNLSPESDIDLLLIGSYNLIDAQKKIVKLQKKYDREINTIDMTEKEFKQKRLSSLIKNIFSSDYIQIL